MSHQKTVYVEKDTETFLAEEKFLSGLAQTTVLNRAIRLYALGVNRERLVEIFGKDVAAAFAQVLESDTLSEPIPLRVSRK